MPVWRCPHCGIPQPETARCWVCHRSTTSCGTCRHYRRGIAGGLGLCGLDVRRRAVGPADVRPCWTRAVTEPDADAAAAAASGTDRPGIEPPAVDRLGGRPTRTFVPVEELVDLGANPLVEAEAPGRGRSAEPASAAAPERGGHPATTATVAAEPRWSLWGDLEG